MRMQVACEAQKRIIFCYNSNTAANKSHRFTKKYLAFCSLNDCTWLIKHSVIFIYSNRIVKISGGFFLLIWKSFIHSAHSQTPGEAMKKQSGRKGSSSSKRLLSKQQGIDETISKKGIGCCPPAAKFFRLDVICSGRVSSGYSKWLVLRQRWNSPINNTSQIQLERLEHSEILAAENKQNPFSLRHIRAGRRRRR